MYRVNIHEAKTHFSKLIRKVLNGEEVIISKGNKPVAKLVALDGEKLARKLGTAKGQIAVAPDFDEPLADFKDYIP